MKKSVDQLCAEYASSWKGFRIDGTGKLVLVKASDDLHLATKAYEFAAPTKAYDEKAKLYIAGVANAKEVDRMVEVLDPAGLIDQPYRKNPILLRQHNHDWPIGNVTLLQPEDSGVKFEAWVGDPSAAPLTPMQIESRSLIAQRVLRAVSVGFIPHKIRMPAYNDAGEIVDPAMIEKWEMLELSGVAVPCNAGAIFEAKRLDPSTTIELRFIAIPKAKVEGWLKDHGAPSGQLVRTDDGYTYVLAGSKSFEDQARETVELAPGVTALVGKRKQAKAIVFPVMGKGGRLETISPKEMQGMEELKELLTKMSGSMSDLAKGINVLVDGQKATNEALTALKGKKPKADPAEEDDDEDMKKSVVTLQKTVKEQGESINELVDTCTELTKTVKSLIEKAA